MDSGYVGDFLDFAFIFPSMLATDRIGWRGVMGINWECPGT